MRVVAATSALRGKANLALTCRHVAFDPEADIRLMLNGSIMLSRDEPSHFN
jgi:hypothetical protein